MLHIVNHVLPYFTVASPGGGLDLMWLDSHGIWHDIVLRISTVMLHAWSGHGTLFH